MAVAVRPTEERRLLGIGLVLLSFLLFAIIDSCAKWLSQAGMPTSQVVFIRYAGQFLLITAFFLPMRGRDLLVTRRPGLEAIRGLCLVASTGFNFTALVFLPLTVTSAILFTSPLMIVALSIPLLGETVGWRRWAAIFVGFIGILIIVRPGTEAFHPAVLLSLGCAFFTALYMLLTRKLAGVDAVSTQQFYASLVGTLCVVPFVIMGGWVWPADPASWFAFIMIGVAAVVGHQVLTLAHNFAPASVLAPFSYVQMIYLTAASWFIFNEGPDIWLLLGAPIVIGSGLYVWLRERQLSKSIVTEAVSRD